MLFAIRPAQPADADELLALFDAAEREARHEVVDESERQRVARLRTSTSAEDVDAAWRPLVAHDSHTVAYGALTLPDEAGGTATGEVVVDPDHRLMGVGAELAGRLEDIARADGAGRFAVWARAGETSHAFAEALGYEVDRRLDVLGRPADDVEVTDPPDGVTLRSYRPGTDDADVIAVLNDAFADHPDPAWTPVRLQERRSRPWFDADGVVVAEDREGVVGVHWTKDRGEGVAEVHILGVARRGHGGGLGRALLLEGLRRMHAGGAHEVLLWMEADNEPARRLYRSVGFTHRWSMVSFARDLD